MQQLFHIDEKSQINLTINSNRKRTCYFCIQLQMVTQTEHLSEAQVN